MDQFTWCANSVLRLRGLLCVFCSAVFFFAFSVLHSPLWVSCSSFLYLCNLFCIPPFFIPLFVHSVLHSPLLFCFFCFVSTPEPGDGAGMGASRSAGQWRDTHPDRPCLLNDFIREYGAHLDSQRIPAMRMNENRACALNVRFRSNCDTSMATWKKKLWPWGGRIFSICPCISSCVDSPFVQCFEEVDYERHLASSLLLCWIWWCLKLSQQLKYSRQCVLSA